MRKILLPPILLLLCIAAMIANSKYGISTETLQGTAKSFGYVFIAIGILLPAWGARIFKKVETNIIPYKSPDKIVTDGPFRFSRNPMYLGMLLVLIGVWVLLGSIENLGFVLLFFIVANWWYIPFEEAKMQAVFGDAFDDYKARVRRWL